jgi:signal transduction histidine kinase
MCGNMTLHQGSAQGRSGFQEQNFDMPKLETAKLETYDPKQDLTDVDALASIVRNLSSFMQRQDHPDQPERLMAKRAFLRQLSHEIRTPLNSIIGFSDVISQELYGPLGASQYADYARIINDSGLRLLNLMNHILDIARSDETLGLELETLDLYPFLGDCLSLFDTRAKDRGLALKLVIDDQGLKAAFDSHCLSMCLDKLICNALDFTPENQTITLSAAHVGPVVEVRVFNPGKAPRQMDIERLMAPFEQGHCERPRLTCGSGLGWSIVQVYSRAMGASFRIESEPGFGLMAKLGLKSAL